MSMENLVEDFYIQLEETRNKLLSCQDTGVIGFAQVDDFHVSLDSIYRVVMSMLDFIPFTTDDDGENLFEAMRKSCIEKASQFCCDLLNVVLNSGPEEKVPTKSSKRETDHKTSLIDDGMECQQAIASMMENSFRIFSEQHTTESEECSYMSIFTDKYSKYQRAVLRHRSKPPIANLANMRKIAKVQSLTVYDYLESTMQQESDRSDSDTDKDKWAHANTITVILGEASSLIHPLIVWKEGLLDSLSASRDMDSKSRSSRIDNCVQSGLAMMCDTALDLLHKEAQNLTIKVGEWFIEDMADIVNLSDSSLEEMAFICQVLQRYNALTCHLNPVGKDESLIEKHLAEQIFRYSTAETNFLSTNILKAIEMAQPVQIIMGVERYVPSIVEDAYYISQRCLERASSTLSPKTAVLVMNSVVDTWGTSGAIYNALVSQKGCNSMGKNANVKTDNDTRDGFIEKSPNSGLQLFLNALERDIDKSPQRTDVTNNMKANGMSVDVHTVQLDTQFCLLNGIHAASVACEGLGTLFGSLLPEGVNDAPDHSEMMFTVKEQMKQYSTTYDLLLDAQIDTLLEEWVGKVHTTGIPPPLIASLPHAPSIHRLFYYFSKQNYELNATSLRGAEEHTKFLIIPFEESRIITELHKGKCDDQLAFKLVQAISHDVSNLFLSTLFNQKNHQFTEWGALLLAKQIRILEEYFCSHIVKNSGNTLLILQEFKKLSQTLAIIQLSHPQDCKDFKQSIGHSNFDLNQDEIRCAMKLRCDWTEEAINAAFNN